jgi:DNA sulfur modification protein DndE
MIRFKLDKDTTDSIDKITSIFNFSKETVAIRICFAYSIQQSKRYVLDNLVPSPSNGREFLPTSNVFGKIINDRDNFIIYNSVLSVHYGMEINLELCAKLFKLHCEDGASKILQKLSNVDFTSGEHFTFLMKLVKNGLDLQSDTISVSNIFRQSKQVNEYSEPLSFIIGKTENNETIEIKINDLREFDNRNIAIAGMAGSGKNGIN